MIQKKICLLGTSGVGKTSLISQFVRGIFSDRYLTSVGVKVDKKTVPVGHDTVDLVIWDIYGHDEFQSVRRSYLRGSKGCLLVADGTRADTLEKAIELQRWVEDAEGAMSFVLALNKADLQSQWQIGTETMDRLASPQLSVLRTSAKTGDGVEAAFTTLARLMTS